MKTLCKCIAISFIFFVGTVSVIHVDRQSAMQYRRTPEIMKSVEIAVEMVYPLPNREYYQYSVKMTWTTAESHCGVLIHTIHCIEQIYIWNDTSKNNAYWHLHSQSYTSKSTTIY